MRYFYLFGGVADSSGKLKFTNVRMFPSHDTLCRLLGIRDNLPAFNTWQIYSLSLALSQNVINLRGIPNDFAVRCLRNLLIVAPTTLRQGFGWQSHEIQNRHIGRFFVWFQISSLSSRIKFLGSTVFFAIVRTRYIIFYAYYKTFLLVFLYLYPYISLHLRLY